MPNTYTEGHLVEQPAIGLFPALGWQVPGRASPANRVMRGMRQTQSVFPVTGEALLKQP